MTSPTRPVVVVGVGCLAHLQRGSSIARRLVLQDDHHRSGAQRVSWGVEQSSRCNHHIKTTLLNWDTVQNILVRWARYLSSLILDIGKVNSRARRLSQSAQLEDHRDSGLKSFLFVLPKRTRNLSMSI
jgi:hypothetical protein